MSLVLTLDAALAGCSAGLVRDGQVVASLRDGRSQAAGLPDMVEQLLRGGAAPHSIAVTVGPGSFTGLRAALALAHGVALALAVPLHGVTCGAAMAHRAPRGREFWAAIDSKRGRVFLERDGEVGALGLDELPDPAGKIAIAGDAAVAVASRLAARGFDVQLLDVRAPDPLGIALAAALGPIRAAQPLYVDPPAVRPGPPARPAPA